MRSSGTTAANPQFLYIFRGNNSGSANRLQVNVDKTGNQIVLGQYVAGTYSTLGSKSSITTSFDTDYEIQIAADGRHVEVWWGTAGSDLAKVIEVETASVLSGPRYHFLVMQDTVVRVDDISITMPDLDTSTYTYNNGNELLTMVKGSTTTTFTYDDWGRQVSKIIGANSAVYGYRFGIKGAPGKSLLRKCGERSFAHCYENGAMRRCHLRGRDNIFKRMLLRVCAFNLGLQTLHDTLRIPWNIPTPHTKAVWQFVKRAIRNFYPTLPSMSVARKYTFATGC